MVAGSNFVAAKWTKSMSTRIRSSFQIRSDATRSHQSVLYLVPPRVQLRYNGTAVAIMATLLWCNCVAVQWYGSGRNGHFTLMQLYIFWGASVLFSVFCSNTFGSVVFVQCIGLHRVCHLARCNANYRPENIHVATQRPLSYVGESIVR